MSSSAVTLDSSVVFPAGGTGNPISIATVYDEKGTVDGGTATSGQWNIRDLNTTNDPNSIIVSLTSDQFTLSAGQYFIQFSVPGFQVNTHQCRLYDVTGSTALRLGSIATSGSSDVVQTDSIGSVNHSPTSNNTYELHHRVASSKSTTGEGLGWGVGNNVYAQVIIYKLK